MKEPNCENCMHYIQHYIKGILRYHRIFCGHCKKIKANGQYRKTDKPCEFYIEKDIEKEKQEQIKSAVEYLSFITNRINELTEILKNE